GPLYHRSRAAPSAFVFRLWHPPLRRQPVGGNAIDDPVGGDPQSLPADRGRREAKASLLKPDPRHHRDEGAHPGVNAPAPGGSPGWTVVSAGSLPSRSESRTSPRGPTAW